MNSLNIEQRKEKRSDRRGINLACWGLVICSSLGFGHRCLAQSTLFIADPGSWSFGVNGPSIDFPSEALLAGGVFNMRISSIGMDMPIPTAQPTETVSATDAVWDLSPPPCNWQGCELTLTVPANIGSAGLLNLSSSSMKILDKLNLMADAPALNANDPLEIRFDRVTLEKTAPAAPLNPASDASDRFDKWIVKPASISTFASDDPVDAVLSDDPSSLSNSVNLSLAESHLLGLGETEPPAVPLPASFISDTHVATLAGP